MIAERVKVTYCCVDLSTVLVVDAIVDAVLLVIKSDKMQNGVLVRGLDGGGSLGS